MKNNTFEQRLTALYDAATAKKAAALAQLQAAKKTAAALKESDERESAYTAAERAYSAAVTDADATLNADRASLRTKLKADIGKRSLANPDDVVPAAVTLLNSDILTAADLLALAERFSTNFTMLRLIASRTRQAMCVATTFRDHAERDALDQVVSKCQGFLNADLISFDRLAEKLASEQTD